MVENSGKICRKFEEKIAEKIVEKLLKNCRKFVDKLLKFFLGVYSYSRLAAFFSVWLLLIRTL